MKNALLTSLFAMCLSASATAEISFTPGISIQQKDLNFQEKGINVDGRFRQNINANLTSVVLESAVHLDRFFISMGTEIYDQDSNVSSGITFLEGRPDIEQTDSHFRIGMQLPYNFSIFTGFESRTTTINKYEVEQEFKEEGIVMGVEWFHEFYDTGALTVSTHIANLDGEFTSKDWLLSSNLKGNDIGQSLSIEWSGQISQGLDYVVGHSLEYHKMKNSNAMYDGSEISSLSIEQKSSTFSIGLKMHI